jgi:hypothetical protein
MTTCVGTQSPKYLEMAQWHISLSEGSYGGVGRWLHPPAEAGARSTVHPCLPCVFEQGVAEPVVLSPERRRDASAVFSMSGDRRRQ